MEHTIFVHIIFLWLVFKIRKNKVIEDNLFYCQKDPYHMKIRT